MHYNALKSGESFAEMYGGLNKIVVDIGGLDVNGSLRAICESLRMKYICVDIVIKPCDKLPF
jgi:hypothetical protein